MSEEEDKKQTNKKVHLDPFAQLERALLESKNQNKKNDLNQRIPLQQTICQSKVQKDEFVHEIYTPISYSKPEKAELTQNHHKWHLQTEFERQVFKIYQQQESIVLIVSERNKLIKSLKKFIQISLKMQKKIVLVCKNQKETTILYGQLIQLLKNNKIIHSINQQKQDKGFCWLTTLPELRKATFQQMSSLNKFDGVLFQNISLDIPIFQQILITLPLQLNYHLLYTYEIENINQIMNWLTKLRVRPFHLIYEKQGRILPEIYGITAKSKGLFKLINSLGVINHSNVQKINQSLEVNQYLINKSKKNQSFLNYLKDTVKLLYSLDKYPVLCLASTKRDVEKYTRILCQMIDFTTKEQKQMIQLYLSTCTNINPELKELKSFKTAREYLTKGIGIYHEGLLPTLREVVLLLSEKQLLKVLVSKQDSISFGCKSYLINYDESEYKKSNNFINIINLAQKDKGKQILILLYLKNKLGQKQLERLITKYKKTVNSQFDLKLFSYLNYLSFEDMDPEYVLARSFKQMQNYNRIEQLKQQQKYILRQIDNIIFQDIEPVKAFHLCKQKKKEIEQLILKKINNPENIIPYLSVGRLIHLQVRQIDWGIGVVVNFTKIQQPKNQINYFVDALVSVKSNLLTSKLEPALINQNDRLEVVTFDLGCIKNIKTLQFTQLPNNIKQPENKALIFKSLRKILTFQLKSVKIQLYDKQYILLKKELNTVLNQQAKLLYLQPIYSDYLDKNDFLITLSQISQEINNLSSMFQKDKLKVIHKIAKHMDYVSKKKITKTGKAVACLQSRFSSVIVELMKENLFQKFTGSELAALLVSLVEDQKINTQRLKVTNLKIREGLNIFIEKTKEICKMMRKQKLEINEYQQIELIKQQYIEAILSACQGRSLDQICDQNSIYQGNLLQIMKNLTNLLKQMKRASSTLLLKRTELIIDQTLVRIQKISSISNFSILL